MAARSTGMGLAFSLACRGRFNDLDGLAGASAIVTMLRAAGSRASFTRGTGFCRITQRRARIVQKPPSRGTTPSSRARVYRRAAVVTTQMYRVVPPPKGIPSAGEEDDHRLHWAEAASLSHFAILPWPMSSSDAF